MDSCKELINQFLKSTDGVFVIEYDHNCIKMSELNVYGHYENAICKLQPNDLRLLEKHHTHTKSIQTLSTSKNTRTFSKREL